MRVSFVLPYAGLAGGIRVVAYYADHLKRRGHEVFVVSQPAERPKLRQRAKQLVSGQRHAESRSFFDGLAVKHSVLERERPITDSDLPDADVVIATWWETAEWVSRLSPRKGKKAYFIQGHEVHDHLPKERVRATYELPLARIVVSEWLKEIMRAEYGVDVAGVVPNGVDLELFPAAPRPKASVPTFGVVYAPQPLKNVAFVTRAYHRLRRTLGPLRLIAFGAHDISATAALPPSAEYHRYPAPTDIPKLYAACDAWLMPSYTEGFGLPMLEALACNTPIIATKTGIAPELVAAKAGFLVDHDDTEALAGTMERVARMDSTQWQALSATARSVAERYDWEPRVAAFEALLARTANAS